MKRRKQIVENLEHLRKEWETSRDLATLRQAVLWGRDYPLPKWVAEAIDEHFKDLLVSPKEKQRRTLMRIADRMVLAVRDAIYGDKPYPLFYAHDDERPSEAHFRLACERLNSEGLHCNSAAVKKAWQRHKPLSLEVSLDRIGE